MRTTTLTTAVALSALLVVGPAVRAHSSSERRSIAQAQSKVPVFRVTVVARTTPAINYEHRSGATTIDFRGTPLLPQARGEAKI